jgi:hypothetical protein
VIPKEIRDDFNLVWGFFKIKVTADGAAGRKRPHLMEKETEVFTAEAAESAEQQSFEFFLSARRSALKYNDRKLYWIKNKTVSLPSKQSHSTEKHAG